MTPLSERMVEAAARVMHEHAGMALAISWDDMVASRVHDPAAVKYVNARLTGARAALTAALAVAEAEGAGVFVVPEPIKIGNHFHGHETLRAEGYNDAIDDMLAGRVTL